MFPLRMAIIAGIAVVGITGNANMMLVGIRAIVFVAQDAFKLIVIIGDNMAIGAEIPFLALLMTARIDREILGVMIEIALVPAIGVMALLAISRVSNIMIRLRDIIVILMTGQTLGRSVIESIGVALDARSSDMLSGEWE